jgi:hypothetical protein
MIREGYPKFSSFSASTCEKMMALDLGSCLLRYEPDGTVIKTAIVLPFFRAHVSSSLLLDKAERKSLLYRLTGESIDTFVGIEKDEVALTEEVANIIEV